MVAPTGIPQKKTATTKDVLLDFLAGGTGLFFLIASLLFTRLKPLELRFSRTYSVRRRIERR